MLLHLHAREIIQYFQHCAHQLLLILLVIAVLGFSQSAEAANGSKVESLFENLTREAVAKQFSAGSAICQPIEQFSKSQRTAGLGWQMRFYCGTQGNSRLRNAVSVQAVLNAFSHDHPTISLRNSRKFMQDKEQRGGTGMIDTRRTRWTDNDTYAARTTERILQWQNKQRSDTHRADVAGDINKAFDGIPLRSSLSGSKPATIRIVIKVAYSSKNLERVSPTADTVALAIADHIIRGLSGDEPTPTATVTFHDANPVFSKTGDVLPADLKPTELIRAKNERKGAATDGESRLIVRAQLSSEEPVKFRLDGKEPGEIEPLLAGRTVTLAGKHYAFALFTPPERFDDARAATMPKSPMVPPSERLGDIVESRNVKLEVVDNENEVIASKEVALVRPPVVLVHGLFSDPFETWINTFPDGSSMVVMLEKAGYLPFLVNYQNSNGREVSKGINEDGSGEPAGWLGTVNEPRISSSFGANRNVVWDSPIDDYTPFAYERGWLKEDAIRSEHQLPKQTRIGGISEALSYYRKDLSIAATQATVIGHSMGGILARVWASPNYNPDYKAPRNFNAGDIYRLMTLNTPHHGSELIELKDALKTARIDDEAWLDWSRRNLVNTVIGWFLDPEPDAVRDLRPGSAALKKIGPTVLPSFAITTSAASGQFNSEKYDPYSAYNGLYSAAGMVFFQNRPLLDSFVQNRFMRWRNTAAPFKKTTDWRGQTSSMNGDDETLEAYRRSIAASIDQNVYYWAKRREEDSRDDLRSLLRKVVTVPFGSIDAQMGNQLEIALTTLSSTASQIATGTDVSRFFDDAKASDVPETFIAMLHDLVFHNDAKSDGAVRVESQRGGIKSHEHVDSVLHSYAAWHYEVQRKVIFALKWQPEVFDPEGFPDAGQLAPRYLPSDILQEERIEGESAIFWSGMVPSHAEQYRRVADEEDTMILVRPVNPSSTPLLANNAAAKGMNIKGKSSSWGPQIGYIPVDQRYSKLWHLFRDPAIRDNKISEYNAEVCKSLTTNHPEMPEKKYAEARPLQVVTNDKGACLVLTDPEEADAEKSVVLKCGEAYFDWRNAQKDGDAIFDPWASLRTLPVDEDQARRLNQNPLGVLADGTQSSLPYLTADYDLLAIGFRRDDDFHGPPPEVTKAKFDKLRGIISPKQVELLEKVNAAVADKTGYKSGWVTHHGPENQYPKSPYIDYPVLVFDPGSKANGDATSYLIRQGPPGFRDVHLKRFFSEQSARQINLWPNPKSKGWQWEKRRKFDLARGYDPRDADDLLLYIEEAPKPETSRAPPTLVDGRKVSDLPPVKTTCEPDPPAANETVATGPVEVADAGTASDPSTDSNAAESEAAPQQADDDTGDHKESTSKAFSAGETPSAEPDKAGIKQDKLEKPTAPSASEQALWDDVKDSDSADELSVYLGMFPKGFYAPLAEVRLKRLKKTVTPDNQNEAADAENGASPDASRAIDETTSKPLKVTTVQRTYSQFQGSIYAGQPDPAGGYLMGGELQETDGTIKKALLFSVDPSGEVRWSKSLSGSRPGTIDRIHALPSGGFIVIGASQKPDGKFDAWAKRVESGGSVLWTKSLGTYETNLSNAIYVPSSNGLIWLLAKAETPRPYSHLRMFQADQDGTVKQQFEIDESDSPVPVGAILLNEASYVISTISNQGLLVTRLTKLNASGHKEWTRQVGDNEKSVDGWHIARTHGGDILIAGQIEYSNDKLAQNVWLAKFNTDAKLIWEREIDIRHHDIATAVVEMDKGIIFVSAEIRSKNDSTASPWLGAFSADGKTLRQTYIGDEKLGFAGAIAPVSRQTLMIAGTRQVAIGTYSPGLVVLPDVITELGDPSQHAANNDPPRHECDELASHPYNPQRKADGVWFEQMDVKRALRACEEALKAHPGSPRFQYLLARAKHKSGNKPEAKRLSMMAAEAGYGPAISTVGDIIYKEEKNYEEALRWFRAAADQGDPGGMNGLGHLYRQGQAVKKDMHKAVDLYEKASRLGYLPAMHNLSYMYREGLGVDKNLSKSLELLNEAAAKGYRHSMHLLGFIYAHGEKVPKDEKTAFSWYLKAAEAGLPAAMLNVALSYADGNGVEKNFSKAHRWFLSAAEHDNDAAMLALGAAYGNASYGLKQDFEQSYYWHRKSAEAGNRVAMNSLGYLLETGQGTTAEIVEAATWYKRSAEAGYFDGMISYAMVLYTGKGVVWPKQEESAQWMIKALKTGVPSAKQRIFNILVQMPETFIVEMQKQLAAENAYDGRIDGKYGPAMRRAIEQVSNAASTN